jgi:hypothetical protein
MYVCMYAYICIYIYIPPYLSALLLGVVSPYYCMYRDLLRRPPPQRDPTLSVSPITGGWSPPITACTETY